MLDTTKALLFVGLIAWVLTSACDPTEEVTVRNATAGPIRVTLDGHPLFAGAWVEAGESRSFGTGADGIDWQGRRTVIARSPDGAMVVRLALTWRELLRRHRLITIDAPGEP